MKKLIPWLGASLVVVITFGTIYAAVQQSQRRSANYPQIQIAEDAATALDKGAGPASLASGKVDIGRSLAPFIIVYDKSGKAVAGSGYLQGKIPQAPIGILAAAKGKDYSFVTWQPAGDARIAAVSVAAHNYYVLSGRSLKEVEKNENQTLQLVLLGGIASMLTLAVSFAAVTKRISLRK